MRVVLNAIKKLLLAFAGGIGGGVFGGIVLLLLLHCRIVFNLELPSFWLMLLAVISVFVVAGTIVPKFFMMFALSPISWLLSSDGAEATTWPEFIYNASYMLGLVLFGFGVCFSIPWLVAVGVVGILLFAVGVIRNLSDKEGEQDVTPNA